MSMQNQSDRNMDRRAGRSAVLILTIALIALAIVFSVGALYYMGVF